MNIMCACTAGAVEPAPTPAPTPTPLPRDAASPPDRGLVLLPLLAPALLHRQNQARSVKLGPKLFRAYL